MIKGSNSSNAFIKSFIYEESFNLRRSRGLRLKKRIIFLAASAAIILCVSVFYSINGRTKPSLDGLNIAGKVVYSEYWTVGDMRDALDCDRIFRSERPVHSQNVWENSRELYKAIVGKDSSITDNLRDGFLIPVQAKQAPPKGRGIFAARDIFEGELIWSTKKTARFKDGPSYRKFIFGLEDGVACDVLQWAYVQDIGDGNLRVSVDLDEGCFCNGEDNDTDANMGCNEEAAKKIMKGAAPRIILL